MLNAPIMREALAPLWLLRFETKELMRLQVVSRRRPPANGTKSDEPSLVRREKPGRGKRPGCFCIRWFSGLMLLVTLALVDFFQLKLAITADRGFGSRSQYLVDNAFDRSLFDLKC